MVQVCCHLHEVVAVGGPRTGGRVLVGEVLRDAGRRELRESRTANAAAVGVVVDCSGTAQEILVRFER